MKTIIVSFTAFVISLILTTQIFGQKEALPEWIEGKWHNPYESNADNFEFWTFQKDSIFIGHGFYPEKNRECLNTKYTGYRLTTISINNHYKVRFTKGDSIIIYCFSLTKFDYTEKPVLTYTVIINGHQIMDTLSSINLFLTRS